MSIIVKASGKDNNDSIVRKFLKQVTQEDVIREYRDRERYKKASERRQERLAEKRRKIARYRRLSRNA